MPTPTTLNWNANTESDLNHYVVYQGTAPGVYSTSNTVAAPTTTYNPTGLTIGFRWYFVVTAVDNSGNESAHSNEVSKLMQDFPLQMFCS